MFGHKKPRLINGKWTKPDGKVTTDETEIAMIESGLKRNNQSRLPNGQWRKGVSGNTLGRPLSKGERALSKREYRRDVFRVTEELVPAKTPAGVKMLPWHQVNLLSIRAKASQGHAPSQRYLDKLHREAIAAHEEAHPFIANGLEQREAEAVQKSPRFLPAGRWRDLNVFRMFSRRR